MAYALRLWHHGAPNTRGRLVLVRPLQQRADQIEVVQPGQTIIVRNGKVDMYKGFMRLAVDKWGKLEKAPEPATFEVNEINNLSALEYELVNVDE